MYKTAFMNQRFLQKKKMLILVVTLGMICVFPAGSFAAGPPVPSEISKPMVQVLLVIIAALALMIAMLSNVVIGAAQVFMQKITDERKEKESGSNAKILSVILVLLFSSPLFAADAPDTTVSADASIGGMASTTFYMLISVIIAELLILMGLLYNLKVLLAKELVAKATAKTKPAFNWAKWWEKANSFRPIQEESNIDLGHDYDGIRELDNRLPPWWLYGFYCCILFAVIYLYRFHVAHTAPLPKEELQIAMDIAAAEKEAYLKNAANNVNENTVTYLTDPASLEDGKKIFTTICMACHQADGGGNVGPNLTDKYWLHGGSIKDIFKTIKYGWPEKGMKSWEEDYSPLQIAHIASYVKSLEGTKPAKPKEPQGILYEETGTAPAADSAKVVTK